MILKNTISSNSLIIAIYKDFTVKTLTLTAKPIMIIVLFSSLSSVSFAYVDGNNQSYSTTRNQHGVTLKSKKTTIHLGKQCDAYSPQYGKGTWGWANGGLLIDLGSKQIGFPRQESPFDDGRCPL